MLKNIFCFCFITVIFYQFFSCSGNQTIDAHEDSLALKIQGNKTLMELTQKIKDNPNDAELLYQRSLGFMNIDSTQLAYNDIDKAISIDSTKTNYYFLLADIFLRGNYAEGAVGALSSVLKLEPDNQTARTKLAKVYLFVKDYQSSLSQIEYLIKSNENNPDAYFLMGMDYKEMKDTARAIASFQKAVQYNQNFYDAYMQLGLLHSAQKKNIAPEYFDNAIRLDSSKSEAWYAKAKYYQDLGDDTKNKNSADVKSNYNEAKKTYRQLIIKNPQYQYAYFNLGFIYMQQDSIDKALRQFDIATKVSPQYAEAYYYRGLCEVMLGKKEEAESDFQQALNLKPEYSAAQKELDALMK